MTDIADRPTAGRPPWSGPAGTPDGYSPFPAEAVDGSIGDRLREVADQHGDRPALRGPDGHYTHAELWSTVQERALALAERVEGDDPAAVALLTSHDAGQVVDLLAVVTAGHAALVLDPTAPPELNRTLLDDASAAVLICDEAHDAAARELAGGQVPVVGVGDLTGAEGTLPDDGHLSAGELPGGRVVGLVAD
ncbi:MAG: AMP-binding protein, partial [Actinomycetota bacterium]